VAGEGLLNLLVEVASIKRFDKKAVCAGLEAGRHLLRPGICTDHEDGNVLGGWAAAQRADQMERVDVGQGSVEQDEIKGPLIGLVQTFVVAVGDNDVAAPSSFQDNADRFEGGGIVVHNQDVAKAVGTRCGGHGTLGLLGGRRLGDRMGPIDIGARHAGIIARGPAQLNEKAVLIGQISRDLYGHRSGRRKRARRCRSGAILRPDRHEPGLVLYWPAGPKGATR